MRHRQPSLCLALAFSVPVNFVENALALRLRMDRTAACLSADDSSVLRHVKHLHLSFSHSLLAAKHWQYLWREMEEFEK